GARARPGAAPADRLRAVQVGLRGGSAAESVMPVWIKICGTTNLEDALASVEAGADALGFIFAPSPRRVSPHAAAKIIRELPRQIEKFGVFVNQGPNIILQTVLEAGLTGVQLHGDEDP